MVSGTKGPTMLLGMRCTIKGSKIKNGEVRECQGPISLQERGLWREQVMLSRAENWWLHPSAMCYLSRDRLREHSLPC